MEGKKKKPQHPTWIDVCFDLVDVVCPHSNDYWRPPSSLFTVSIHYFISTTQENEILYNELQLNNHDVAKRNNLLIALSRVLKGHFTLYQFAIVITPPWCQIQSWLRWSRCQHVHKHSLVGMEDRRLFSYILCSSNIANRPFWPHFLKCLRSGRTSAFLISV